MFGTSAYNKRIPEELKHLPLDYKRALLQGYLESDGSVFIDRRKVRVNFTSVNLELLEDVQDMLFGMNIANSIVLHSKETTKPFNSKQSYRMNVSRIDQWGLADNPVFYSKKIRLLKSAHSIRSIHSKNTSKMGVEFKDNNILLKVENIKQSSYTGIVYNFECDTHTFMCRNILTHNCDP